MTIQFNAIPTTLRVPWVYVEFDNSRAQQGPSIQKYKTLVIGQRLAAGSVSELVPTQITSDGQARLAFGAGSQLYGILSKYLAGDKVTELWAIAQDDAATGVSADGSVLFVGAATADGTVYLYVGGRVIKTSVTSGDSAADVATAVTAAITAESLSYVSAAVDGTVVEKVNLTAKNDGELGNEIDVRLNYLTTETLPAGVTATVTPMASGANNPDVDDVLAVLPEEQYNLIVYPYTDTTNLTKLKTELLDRFGPLRQNDGVAVTAKAGTLSELASVGNAHNSQLLSFVGTRGPTPSFEWAAAQTAQMAKSGQADPAKPFQTLGLVGVLPPTETDRFTLAERNNLLYDGVTTWKVGAGDVVRIERAITTYKTNDAGADDTSYLDVNTLLTLSYLRYSFRNRILAKYSRHKLANDGTRFGPGQQIITPKIGRAEAVALFAEWQSAGLVEGIEQFKRDLIVERNDADANRLDFLLPPDLINQLRVVGAKIQFLI